jgi:sugar transferase (PEP-CTERM system associated)
MISVFGHWVPSKPFIRVILDFLSPLTGVLLAVSVWGFWWQANLGTVINYGVIFALVMVVLNAWLGLYNRAHNNSVKRTRVRILLSLFLSIPIAYSVVPLLSITVDNQKLLLLAGFGALMGTLAHHAFRMHSQARGLMVHRVLVYGAGPRAQTVAEVAKNSDPDIHLVGFYPSPTETEISVLGELLLRRSRSLSDTARALNADEIIVAVPEQRGGILPLRELLDCKLFGVTVLDLASHFERRLGQIRLDSLRAGWLIFGDGFRQDWLRTLVKRLFDIVAASVLIVFALPVMLITALLIVMEDGFPVFYRQERVGLDGRVFTVIKFRSMRRDAESDGKPRWATGNDNRTTRVGRFIRRLRIDELPQLYCVLSGDMSLVGPRPERPYFVDQLIREIPFYAVRHSVKPGVTGWAQVSYHYGASVNDSIQKLQYDLYYVKNHSLFLDCVILFETVGVVLTGKGAQ